MPSALRVITSLLVLVTLSLPGATNADTFPIHEIEITLPHQEAPSSATERDVAIVADPVAAALTLATLGHLLIMDVEVRFRASDHVAISVEPMVVRLAGDGLEVAMYGALLGPRLGFGADVFDDGFWMRPGVGAFAIEDDDDDLAVVVALGGGYQWVWASGFTMQLGASMGVGVLVEESTWLPLPGADFGLGYAF